MWTYILRRVLYNVPVYLGIILLMMAALRVHDPIPGFLGKYATAEEYAQMAAKTGLDQGFLVQYLVVPGRHRHVRLQHDELGPRDAECRQAALRIDRPEPLPERACTDPDLDHLDLRRPIAAFFRGRLADRMLVIFAVLAMGKWGGRELNYSSDIDFFFLRQKRE